MESSNKNDESSKKHRHAFNVEYAPANAETEDDTDNFRDELEAGELATMVHSRGGRSSGCATMVALVAVGMVVVLVGWGFSNNWFENQVDGSRSNDIHDDGSSFSSSGNIDNQQEMLGTCRDPIMSILESLGGNAIDAAVAVALCLGVANPASSGIGGGAFIMIHAPNTRKEMNQRATLPPFWDARTEEEKKKNELLNRTVTEVIDCREVAPRLADRDMFLQNYSSNGSKDYNPQASTFGGLAVGIPGELKGLELAHARHGKLEWNQVLQPVVELADRGVPVNANLANEILSTCRRISKLNGEQLPQWLAPIRKILTRSDDWKNPLQEGDVLRNPALAETLRTVMERGVSGTMKEVAPKLAGEIQKAGGIMEADELTEYRPTLRSPVIAHDVYGFSVAGVPPPSSGGAAIIGILRFLAMMPTPFSTYVDTQSKHFFVEACKHIFAIRMSLSDPNFNSDVVNDALNDLVASEYIAQLFAATPTTSTLPLSKYGGVKWAQLDDDDGNQAAKDAQEGDRHRKRRTARRFGYLDDHGTSHFSVADKFGNAVAMTSSVNTVFASLVMSESTGILLNNQMDDFATPGTPNGYGLVPAESNYIRPGKKPLSSMSPTFVFRHAIDPIDNKPTLGPLVLALGASGGPKIITAVAQVLLNYVILGMPLYESLVHARIHNQLLYHDSTVTTIEESISVYGQERISVSMRTRNALLRRNHSLLEIDYAGTVQAVSVDGETGAFDAVCDVRKGGSPDGY